MMIGFLSSLPDDVGVEVDDLVDAEVLERTRIVPHGVGVLEAGPAARDDVVAALLVALDPVLPAQGVHPQAVNEDDRVGRVRIENLGGHGIPTGPRRLAS